MKSKMKLFWLLLIVSAMILACGQLSVGIEQPTPEPVTSTPVVEPSPEVNADSQTQPGSVRTDTDEPDHSEYWMEVEDYRTGLRFAVPCFWSANVPAPEQDPTGLGSFSVQNFTEQFVTSLGPKMSQSVWEIGGVKFDLGYHRKADLGLQEDATLDGLAYALVNPNEEQGIDAITQVEVDGHQGVRVDSWSIFGKGTFYLLPFQDDLFILFGLYPEGAVDHPDIQAILNSLVLSRDRDVTLPQIMPANPPEGMAVSCMPVQSADVPEIPSAEDTIPITNQTNCNTVTDQEPLMWVVCNVQASFISRNTQPLLGYMEDPFKIGYWQSEGVTRTREEAFNEIVQTHLAETPGGETFTTDQSQFPPLFGQPPENMFGPDDNPAAIVYSEGWGKDGQGAAMLYFKEGDDGKYNFYAIVIAQGHFDK